MLLYYGNGKLLLHPNTSYYIPHGNSKIRLIYTNTHLLHIYYLLHTNYTLITS
jgi:hypothetical protein